MANLRILLVDDEPDILQILQIHLSSFDYDISTADDGTSALNAVNENPPDIVFLDYSLPQLNGKTLLKFIKRRSPDTYVVMVSGRASMDIARECLEFGAFDYIQKPFNLDRVTEVLRAIALVKTMNGD